MTLAGRNAAFIGLGIMGSSMASNIARAGAKMTGWNRTPGRPSAAAAAENGVIIADSIEHAVKDADVIFSCLGDENDAIEVLSGEVARNAKSNAIIVDMSTSGSTAAQTIAERLKQCGLRFLDAPVTGGDVGAKNGTLTILVGGPKADFDEVLPFFEAMGKKIVHCGGFGAGQAMKLCNQILCAVNMIAVSEAFALADALEIDKNLLIDSLSQGAGGSWALSNLGPRIAKNDFAPGFTLEHMLKDLRLADQSAPDCRLPGTDLAVELFKQAQQLNDGSSRQGTQAMFRVYTKTCMPSAN